MLPNLPRVGASPLLPARCMLVPASILQLPQGSASAMRRTRTQCCYAQLLGSFGLLVKLVASCTAELTLPAQFLLLQLLLLLLCLLDATRDGWQTSVRT